ncbi:MAG: aminotransferase class V-fold PLP-dependent enzyme [Caldilineaceae bacterium]|nr:aminotransferase class V-fold PLP-dependent enzyme [Caldilineaceae bacterium]
MEQIHALNQADGEEQEEPACRTTEMEAARAGFLADYPVFDEAAVQELRRREYARLDEQGQVYLDYTGGGLHAASQIARHMELLSTRVLGNPHSHNPTSLAMTELVEGTRAYVLDFFNAAPEEYAAIFTPNASGALKHVGESYPFRPGARFLLTFDNHNSVNGIREFARSRGADVRYVRLVQPDLRLDEIQLRNELIRIAPDAPHLFAFPAQSNFSGVQHPLALIDEAQALGWDVLLDAAAFAPTNRLDLSVHQPDFVSLSFYKIFGYPTGLGVLLARREALKKLQRPWFAGGTITIASVQGDGHHLADSEAAFEDGTVDYLNIPAVETGLRHINSVGIDTIHDRVAALCAWLLDALTGLRHSNGLPLLRVHGPATVDRRGGTITATFYGADGRGMDEQRIEELANYAGISLRTGCFCNPGAGEIAHGLTAEEMAAFFQSGDHISFDELRRVVTCEYQKSIGSIRISLGIATTFDDVYRMVEFAGRFLDQAAADIGPVAYRSEHPVRDGV